MLLIKNLFKAIVLGSLVCTIILSCSSDAADEGQTPDETAVEDFANFAEDSKFKAYIKNVGLVLNRIEDREKALEILETSGKLKLNDAQQTALALALGFEDPEQMNIAYDQLTEEWELLTRRFDLGNQNYSDIDGLIFNELLLIRYNLDLSEVIGLKDLSNEEVHCYYEVCEPPYLDALEPYLIAMRECDGFDRLTTEGNNAFWECARTIEQRFALELDRAFLLFTCCNFYNCGLELPTVVGDEPYDYSQCPDIPIG